MKRLRQDVWLLVIVAGIVIVGCSSGSTTNAINVESVLPKRASLTPFTSKGSKTLDATTTTVSYHNGSVIPNASINLIEMDNPKLPLFVNNDPDSTGRDELADFYADFVQQYLLDRASEYDAQSQPQYIGRGLLRSVSTTTLGWANAVYTMQPGESTPFPDSSIQTLIASGIETGFLPAPDANQLYVLHFPQNVRVSASDDSGPFTVCGHSGRSACAYHSGFAYNGIDVPYTVIPDPTGDCSSICTLQDFQGNALPTMSAISYAASHETMEAITDPTEWNASNSGSWGWSDDATGNEVADLCELDIKNFVGSGGTQNYVSADGHGRIMATTWSNGQQACVIDSPLYKRSFDGTDSGRGSTGCDPHANTCNPLYGVSPSPDITTSCDVDSTHCSGDWNYGFWKAECEPGDPIFGLSESTGSSDSHAIACGGYPTTMRNTAIFPKGYASGCADGDSCSCHTVEFPINDMETSSAGSTYWDVNTVHGECGEHEYVAGVSQSPDAGSAKLESILCCPLGKGYAGVDHTAGQSCYGLVFGPEDQQSPFDWDYGYYKNTCRSGEFVASVSHTWHSGADSILCCTTPGKCFSASASCTINSECCSGVCTNGTCTSVAPPPTCTAAGNSCTGTDMNGDGNTCCSGICKVYDDFFDGVCAGAPFDVGNSTPFGVGNMTNPNYLLGTRISVPTASTLKRFGVVSMSSAGNVMMALYTDNSGSPGTLVAYTTSQALTDSTQEFFPSSEASLGATNYWLVGVYDTYGASIGYELDPTSTVAYIPLTYGDPLPMTFGTANTYTGQQLNYYIVVQ